MVGPLITCCMIVRDEEDHLRDCVRAAEEAVDEWVVYDTGSVDSTRALAADLGCRVIVGQWRDDFAWARNRSLEHATGRWVLILDADDRLMDGPSLRAALEEHPPADALFLLVTSDIRTSTGELCVQSCWQPRVFRADAGIRYICPIHEVPELVDHRVGAGPGVVRHIGYLDVKTRHAKARRALEMLELLPAEDTHRHYHTMRTLAVLGRDAGVVESAERLASLQPTLPPDARGTWARSLLKLARPADAVRVLTRGLQDHPESPDLYHGLFLAGGFGFLAEALNAAREPGWYAGIRSASGQAGAVAATLVEQGLLDPSVLTDPKTAGIFSPTDRQPELTTPGRITPARKKEGGPWPTDRSTE